MYTYRELQASDCETIAIFPQNEDELFFMFPSATYPLTAGQIVERVKDRLKATVVLDQSEVIAFANLYDYNGESCWLGNVIVAPIHRGMGASKYLVDTMSTIARKELNVRKLKLVCHNTNTRGLLFYTKLGFIPYEISSRQKPSGEFIAGIHMEKEL